VGLGWFLSEQSGTVGCKELQIDVHGSRFQDESPSLDDGYREETKSLIK
jgi:hypothetical protein